MIDRRRFDSLFARLLLAQAVLMVCAGVLFALLLLVERSLLLAAPYAEILAPVLAREAGIAAKPGATPAVQRRAEPPQGLHARIPDMPGTSALRRALAQRGVRVDDVVLELTSSEPTLWLRVQGENVAPVWLGVAGLLSFPQWSPRLTAGSLLLVLMIAALSWTFARRVAGPLEQLRTRILTHTPGRQLAGLQAPIDMPGATDEVAAIATAYAGLLARLERYERDRAILLGGVSHDLRSPLTRIRLAAELLPETADSAARVASILRNVDHVDRLIESFLDYVRAGELPMDEEVDIAQLARRAAAQFERPRGELTVVVPRALHYSPANALLLERLIANLIDNAVKHGRPPVSLTVSTTPGRVCIVVEDAGEGLTPQAALRLQEAFARGDSARGRPGSGLGLAIVRQIVTRLHGELSLDRSAGRQRVRVTLPRTR